MLISNFNKKIIILLFLTILSGNANAVEYLDKISDKIKFPTLKVLDNKDKPLILKFDLLDRAEEERVVFLVIGKSICLSRCQRGGID